MVVQAYGIPAVTGGDCLRECLPALVLFQELMYSRNVLYAREKQRD